MRRKKIYYEKIPKITLKIEKYSKYNKFIHVKNLNL